MNTITELLSKTAGTIPVTSIDKNLPVDWSKMDDATIAHLAWHGLKQKANDPNGAKTLDESAKLANSQKVIDQFEANTIRMVSGRIADPVEAEIMRLALAHVSNALLKLGEKLNKYTMKDLRDRAQELIDKGTNRAKFTAQAEKLLAVKVEKIDIED